MQKFKVNITGIQDLRLDPSFKQEPKKVEYKHNYVTFDSTADQESKLQFKLLATGLAVDVEPFKPEDFPIKRDKHCPPVDVKVELLKVDTDLTNDPVLSEFPNIQSSSASVEEGTEVCLKGNIHISKV